MRWMILLFLSLFVATAHGSVFSTIAEDQSPSDGGAQNVHYGSLFLSGQDIGQQDPLSALIGGVNPQEQYFCGRASYDLPVDVSKLTAATFTSLQMTQYLMGGSYRISLLSQNPFVVHAVRSVSVMFFSATVGSDMKVQVFDWSAIRDQHLGGLISALGPESGEPTRVVFEPMSNVTEYFNKGFLLSVISSTGPGSSHVEVYSVTELNEEQVARIPGFIMHSVITKMASGDLTGYAKRLAQLR